MAGVSSGWNCKPIERPSTNACDATPVVANLARTGRQLPPILMQLKPRPDFDEVGLARLDKRPAQLRLTTEFDRPTERGRQRLAAEADAEHRNAAVMRSSQETQLVGHPRPDRRRVVHRPRRAKRNDDVVIEGIRKIDRHRGDVEVFGRHDLQRFDVEASIGEGLADVAE